MCVCVNSTVFKNYAVLSFENPKCIQKEQHNSQRIKVQDEGALACRESSKSRKYHRVLVKPNWLPSQLDVFDRELPVRQQNIFSRRRAACAQRVTTYEISSRKHGLKSKDNTNKRKPRDSCLLSECLACHAVLVSNIFSRQKSHVRATQYDHKTLFQRAGR